ncbi:hypothetical protein [Actinoplanes sp. HUAS TT8]|uniref:hypothetical protein n=1 Tax=Actinoplanes sp. HUAS TT8 TaxID=3447453 RepID=UPI003F521161
MLAAARDDLQNLRRSIADTHDPALSITKISPDFVDEPQLVVEVAGAPDQAREVRISVPVLRRALEKQIDPLGLLAYALMSPEPLPVTWRPKPIGQALAPTLEQWRQSHQRIYRLTPAADQVQRALKFGKDILVVGDPGSGRSALAANFAHQAEINERGVIWLNFTDPDDGPESVLVTLFQAARNDSFLLVIDDMQANLPVLKALFGCIRTLREDFGLTIQVLATSWRAMTDLLDQGESAITLQTIGIDGADTITLMLDEHNGEFSEEVRRDIRDLADGDVHTAASAIEFRVHNARVPSEAELQEQYTANVAPGRQRAALYHLASLGFFGESLPEGEARSLFGDEVEAFQRRGVVHRTDDAFTLGPRRRAGLIIRYALEHWIEAQGPENRPENIVWQHLQAGGDARLKATLSRIDHFRSPGRLRVESLYLKLSREMLEYLRFWLEQSTEEDPAWGDNLGAAVFAAMALTRLHRDEEWLRIATKIRERWRYDDPAQLTLEPIGANTEDFADFEEIAEQMRGEDELYGKAGHPSGMSWQEFDAEKEKAYRNWALGLLLGLEGTAPLQYRDDNRIQHLVRMAARAQQRRGHFFPARVPWVTARIVQGLCSAVIRPRDNETVRRASNWLLSQVDDKSHWWRSGTGSWNTDELATSMALTALVLSGHRDEPKVEKALTWLRSREGQWTSRNREIDLALVLETLRLCTEDSVHPHLTTLLERANQELESSRDVSLDRPEERLRLPFITAQLADIVERTVFAKYLDILRDMIPSPESDPVRPATNPPAGAAAEPVTPFTPPRRGMNEHDLQMWRAAVSQLQGELAEQIKKRSREGVAHSARVQEKLEAFIRHRTRVQDLYRNFDEHTPPAVLEEIDEIGREVCGRAWPEPPFPESDADEAE